MEAEITNHNNILGLSGALASLLPALVDNVFCLLLHAVAQGPTSPFFAPSEFKSGPAIYQASVNLFEKPF